MSIMGEGQQPSTETDKYRVLSVITQIPTLLSDKLDAKFNTISFAQFASDREKYGKDILGFMFSPIEPLEISRELLSFMPNLKVFGMFSMGYDILDLDIFKERGIRVSYIPDVHSDSCADMVFALMLTVSRRIMKGYHQYKDNINTHYTLSGMFLGKDVTSSTIGILGMGSIGCRVAERAKGFRMKILYHNRKKRTVQVESELRAVYVSNLKDMLQQVDFLVICCPLSSATKGIIGAKELEIMKSSAILVNISRGAVVDTDALVDALQRSVIRGAGLDVTSPEPLPQGHPLFNMPNVVITPHMGSSTIETRTQMIEMCMENIIAGIEGKPMPSEISLK